MADRGFIARIRQTAARWRSALSVGGMLGLYELGARIGLPGVNSQAIHDFVNAGHAGPIPFYNFLAGGGTARGALLALGVLPYVTARIYLWVGRALSSQIRQGTESEEARTRALRAMTLGVALAQSTGYLTFVSHIPNAIVSPGVWFTVRSVLLLTGGAAAASLLAEQLLRGSSDDEPVATISAAPPMLAPSSVAEVQASATRDAERARR